MSIPHRMSTACLALGMATVLPVRAADAPASSTVPDGTHARLMAQLRDFQTRQHPADPVPPWKPGLMVTHHDRATLDRGGWRNPYVAGDHYAAGQPLETAKVGNGVTTRGPGPKASAPRAPPR